MRLSTAGAPSEAVVAVAALAGAVTPVATSTASATIPEALTKRCTIATIGIVAVMKRIHQSHSPRLHSLVYSWQVSNDAPGTVDMRASPKAILVTLSLWAVGLGALVIVTASRVGWGFAVAVGVLLVIFPLLSFIMWWIFRFIIDADKVQVVRTLVFRSRATLEFNKIEGVDIQQGPFGRLFDYGRLTISGVGRKQLRTESIDHPDEIARHIRDLIPRQ